MWDLNTYFLIGLNWPLWTSEAGRTKKAYSPTLLCPSAAKNITTSRHILIFDHTATLSLFEYFYKLLHSYNP